MYGMCSGRDVRRLGRGGHIRAPAAFSCSTLARAVREWGCKGGARRDGGGGLVLLGVGMGVRGLHGRGIQAEEVGDVGSNYGEGRGGEGG
eukprot:1159477-Pelagomonas_calceolata.AAC.1